MENKSFRNKIAMGYVKAIVEIVYNEVFGPFTPLINIARDTLKYLQDDDSIEARYEKIEDFVRKNSNELSQSQEKQIYLLVGAIYNCIEQIDFVKEYSVDPNTVVKKLLSQKNYTEDERNFLNQNLSEFLCEVIKYIHIEKERDVDFQIDFKVYFSEKLEVLEQRLRSLEITVSDQGKNIIDHGERIEVLEKENKKNNILPDSTEVFKEIYCSPARLDREEDKEVLLKDIYVVPDYTVPEQDNSRYTDLEEKLKSWLNNGNELEKRFLTVFGEPGIGKSSLISYLLGSGRFKLPAKTYCFKFSDIQCIKTYTKIERLPSEILNEFNMKKEDLNDTLLIMDGLDEVDLGDGGQAELIQEIFNQWTQRENIKNFCILFTCRTARLNKTELKKLRSDCIILEPFSSEQVLKFIEKYTKARNKVQNPLNEESVSAITEICKQFDKNEIGDESYAVNENHVNEIFQIPLILYMILALDVKVESNSDMLSVYDQIFSIVGENSIYNHGKKSDSDFITIKKERKKIHAFSQDAAIKMWELHPQKAVLSEKEYTAIVGEEEDIHKLFSGQYFVEGEGGQELYFIHRSIYEYFVAVRYYAELKNFLEKISEIKECYDQEECVIEFIKLASIASLYDSINDEILKFVLKFCKEDNIVLKENDIFDFFDFLFENEILLSLSENEKGRLERYKWENKTFWNILFILKEVMISLYKPEKAFKLLPEKCVEYYSMYKDKCIDLSQLNFNGYHLDLINLEDSDLSFSDFQRANLSRSNLLGADLTGADLLEVNLSASCLLGVNLSGVNLSASNLSGSDLEQAILSGADLRGTNLSRTIADGVDLSGANLEGANLSETYLSGVNLEGANLRGTNLRSVTVGNYDEKEINVKNAVINSKTRIDAEFKKYMLEHGAVIEE